jgi:UDP-2,4-diacetamido-2,4,6-trideoxy-beta-L-altropyranose hydrolase
VKIAIRTDASNRMGLGHLTRCRTLAAALRKQGSTVHFICRRHPGNQVQALQDEGYSVSALPTAPEQTTTDGDYAAWLGVSQDQDAEETRAALQTNANDGKYDPVDWLIVDHYGLDERWEQQLRPMASRILVIDDLANRPHDCDLLLDQNYSADMENRYDDKLPQNAEHLVGPEYALLRPEYAEWRQKRKNKTDQVRRVFVFFGGTDPDNLTGMTLSALSSPAFERMAVDVVVGANNPNKEAIEAQATAAPQITLHHPRPHLADLMAKADLAIGAGGTTTWERCCLGLPSLVISIAENQRPACDALASANIIEYLGHKDCITEQSLLAAIEKLVSETALRNTLAEASAALVDGRGIQRVMSAIA